MAENPKPQQPAKSPIQRAASGTAKRMAKDAAGTDVEGEGINLCEISRQISAVRQIASQNGPRLTNLENGLEGVRGNVAQLNKATQASLKTLSKRVEELPCTTDGSCPPAQRTTATVIKPPVEQPAPPDAIVEVGRLDENNRIVLNTASHNQDNTEAPMTSGRDRPVREAEDDELADELLERQERRVRRENRRAQLQVGLTAPAPQIHAQLDMPQFNVRAGASPKDQVKAALDYQKQFRDPWYKNTFFHTTWGFVLLFVIFIFFDSIVGLFGYNVDDEGSIVPDENVPAVVEPETVTVTPVNVNVEGINEELRQQYANWQRDVNNLLDDAYARIVLAREKVAAVQHTAEGGRLYPAEDEYLDDAIRLLDEASGMMTVQESEGSND